MKMKTWFLSGKKFQISVEGNKCSRNIILVLFILFIIQVPNAFGQWYVWELSCLPNIDCWDQQIDVPAHENFQVTFTNIFAYTYGRGFGGTEATCANGASVQNNIKNKGSRVANKQ